MIDMVEGAEIILRGDLAVTESQDLQSGAHLIGFRQIPENYSAHQH